MGTLVSETGPRVEEISLVMILRTHQRSQEVSLGSTTHESRRSDSARCGRGATGMQE